MKDFVMNTKIVYINAFLLAAVACAIAASGVPMASQPAVAPHVPLGSYLPRLGENLGCYFTVESREISLSDPQNTALSHAQTYWDISTRTVSQTSPNTIDGLVVKLQHELPGVTVMRDQCDPKIIHLVDASLVTDGEYVLNRKTDLSVVSTPDDLLNILSKKFSGAISGRTLRMSGDFSDDHLTTLTITAKKQSVRDILTDYIPLAHYNHVLWTSAVGRETTKGHSQVLVEFCGRTE